MARYSSDTNIEKVLKEISQQDFYEGQIFHIEKIEKKKPQYGVLNHQISPKILSWLKQRNFQLYIHQSEAINNILDNKNVVIVTATASGKSLAYNIPVLNSLLTDLNSTALYIFPQKALTQDQYTKLIDITNYLGIPSTDIGIYDGDTEKEEKARIRRESRLIMTNPFGLHYYLPYKNLWTRFFKNLRYIIIDEMHQYRGIFGSNFAQVLRRLTRVLREFDAHPIYILCSATIKNPSEVAQKLTGQENFTVINNDGAPNPGRYFVFWDLPLLGTSDMYKSPHTQTRYLFNYIVDHDIQTLAFTKSRKMAELNAYYSKLYFKQKDDEVLYNSIISYRAGLNPDDRRKIENGLRNRDIIGVYATNALELGVDIGSLECSILSGFPGTIASMWQQVGRAGRMYNPDTSIESLSFLIPMQDPLDLYYVHHPEEVLTKPHESCNINLDNKYILKNHIKCATKEAPLTEKDANLFGSKYEQVVHQLEEEGVIKKKGTRYFYNSTDNFPPGSVNLSSISDNEFKVILNRNDGRPPVITYEVKSYVFKELHPGAVYLYMAEPYKVENLDIEGKMVILSQDEVRYTLIPGSLRIYSSEGNPMYQKLNSVLISIVEM
jgi:DEAD/DEAH box helicase domain-containing protein